jgi:NTE family protein
MKDVLNQSKKTVGNKPRIGLALGSGSARGWAHIGVIRALAEEGIEPSIVCGSSIGALVGSAYTCNQLDRLEAWVQTLTWRDIVHYMDLTLLGGGFIKGERLMAFFQRHVEDTQIETLPKRFGAVATDMDTGREIWFQSGSLLDAVRASIAVPGIFTPVKLNDHWLLDGGLVNPVPVSLCRAMGADIVIAVNLNGDVVGKHRRSFDEPDNIAAKSHTETETELWEKLTVQLKSSLHEHADELLSEWLGSKRYAPSLFEVMAGSINIMQDRITRSRMAGDPPDVMLAPRLAHIGLLEFDQADAVIEEGRACVKHMLPMLRDVLEI